MADASNELVQQRKRRRWQDEVVEADPRLDPPGHLLEPSRVLGEGAGAEVARVEIGTLGEHRLPASGLRGPTNLLGREAEGRQGSR